MWILLAAIWLSFAGYGYWIASIKGRNQGEGLALGLLLGHVGCCIAATLRERTPEEAEQLRVRLQEEAHTKLEEERERQAAFRAEAVRHRVEAQERAEEARARRVEAYGRFSDWFDGTILKFGWFKALPEVAQPIVIGLLVALPLVIVTILIFRRQ